MLKPAPRVRSSKPARVLPRAKSIAGGNRAHERQSPPIIFKLYNFTT